MTAPLATMCLTGNTFEEKRFLCKAVTESGDPGRLAVVKKASGKEGMIHPAKIINPKQSPGEPFHYLSGLSGEVQERLKAGNGMLLLDASNEGRIMVPVDIGGLHRRLDLMGISARRTVMLTQNRMFAGNYEKWFASSGFGEPIGVEYYHALLRILLNYVQQEMIPSGEFDRRRQSVLATQGQESRRTHAFLCLNFTPRPNRVATMLHLLRHELLEKGLVSFSGLQNYKMDIRNTIIEKLPAYFPEMESLKEELPRLIERGPMLLDTDPMSKKAPVIDVGAFWYYEQTHFSLVTETEGGWEGVRRRFTEKSLKPILGLHPFLIMGNPYTLRDLRALGFKTFHPLINEDYDLIEDDTLRTTATLGELARLCRMSQRERDDFYRELLPVILHNYDHFKSGLEEIYVREVEDPLLRRLNALAGPDPGKKKARLWTRLFMKS